MTLASAYDLDTYCTERERDKMSPLWRYCHDFVENVTAGTTNGAPFPAKVGTTTCNALIDTGATKSVMNKNTTRPSC